MSMLFVPNSATGRIAANWDAKPTTGPTPRERAADMWASFVGEVTGKFGTMEAFADALAAYNQTPTTATAAEAFGLWTRFQTKAIEEFGSWRDFLSFLEMPEPAANTGKIREYKAPGTSATPTKANTGKIRPYIAPTEAAPAPTTANTGKLRAYVAPWEK